MEDNNMREINDTELDETSGGIDRQNPYALEIWYYNPTTQHEIYYRGSYPSQEAAKAAKVQIDARRAAQGYQPRLTKIYKALK